MDFHKYLTEDGHAVLALCSAIAVTDELSAQGVAPFTLSEWNQLARQIENSALPGPSALQGRNADDLAKTLSITLGDADRIARLLGRAGRLALELENLFSRGIWAVTRLDEHYPARLRDSLKHQAPAVLFGAGEIGLAGRAGVGVVGSRNIDEVGAAFARAVGRKAVEAGLPVISGGARGTDRIAMDGAMEAEGEAVGALADSLEATICKSDVRELLLDRRLALLTPYAPSAGFSVGGAMGRNKLIYGLSEFAVVVSSDHQTGGTWSGAVESLKAGWCPVFVRDGETVPKGNRELLKLGAVPLPEAELEGIRNLADWLRDHTPPKLVEPDLFDPLAREPKSHRR